MADEYELKKSSREISRDIPDELLFGDILVRLPVKSLIAYKSVCKNWLYTIESGSFIEAHKHRHCCEYSDQIVFTPFKNVYDHVTKSSSLLPSTKSFRSGLIKMTSRPLDVMLPPEMTRINKTGYWQAAIRVLGPIGTTSIYCVVSYLRTSQFESQDFLGTKIAICNPSMRDYKLASPFPPMEMRRLSKLTDSLFSHPHYGFGVAADGDYKVVLVVTFPDHGRIVSYVYSLRQGTWKKIVDSSTRMVSRLHLRGKRDFPCIYDNSVELCPRVFLNGCWHWIATFRDDTSHVLAFNVNTSHVLAFNVDSETFNLVSRPPSYREHKLTDTRNFSTVSLLNGHLALLDHLSKVGELGTDVISVWMMMKYGDEESWINVWRVNLESYHIRTLFGITYSLREDSNGGIQIERVLFQDYRNKLVSCDEFGAVEIQQLCFDTDSCIFWNTFGISAYSETLERLPPSKHDSVVARLNRLPRRCKLKNQIGC